MSGVPGMMGLPSRADDILLFNLIPSGVVDAYAGAVAPTGYLLCDGAAYPRTTYPSLFAALGGASSPYGLPDGGSFNVPDLRDRVPVGVSATIARGSTGGAKTHTLTTAELPSHSHTSPDFGRYAVTNTTANINVLADVVGGNNPPMNSGSAGGGTAHQNMQPYLGINYIIKT